MKAKCHPLLALTAAFAAILAGCTTSKDALSQAITVLHLRGDTFYSHDGTNWEALKKDQLLTCGDTIKSDEKSQVSLMIGKRYEVPSGINTPNYYGALWAPRTHFENIVGVFGKSELVIDSLSVKRVGASFDLNKDVYDVKMTLKSGNMVGFSRILQIPSTHEVRVGNRVVRVEGGNYGIYSNGVVVVLSRQATIHEEGKGDILVQALHEYDALAGEMRELPRQPTDELPDYVPVSELPPPPALRPGMAIMRSPMTPPTKK